MLSSSLAPTLAQAVWPRPAHAPSRAWTRDIVLVVVFSLLNALCAQIAFPLPGTPVPVTGQTFGVLLTGALLGPRLGAAALLLYLAEGACGLPVFAATGAGQFTLGYLAAFPLAAGLVGWLAARGWDRRPLTMLLAMALGSLVIYTCGAGWLAHFVGASHALALGVLPYLPGDILKALLAAGLLPLGWKLLGAKRGN